MFYQSHRRILLKISGEVFRQNGEIFATPFVLNLVSQLQQLIADQKEIIIVLGGGNICRGRSFAPSAASYPKLDYAGMLGTLINALLFKQFCQQAGLTVGVLSMLQVDNRIMDYYSTEAAEVILQQQKVLVICGGIGLPNFTTDTAASVLAYQLQAQLILLGKKNVDGVYDQDPHQFPNAQMYPKLSYQTLIQKKLAIFDLTAASFNLDKPITSLIFNISKPNAILNALQQKGKLTVIQNE